MNRALKVILCAVTVALLAVLLVTLLSVFLSAGKQPRGQSKPTSPEPPANRQNEGAVQVDPADQEAMHGRELGIRQSAEDVTAWLLGQHFAGEDGPCSPQWESSSDPGRQRCLVPLVCHTWHVEDEAGLVGSRECCR